MQQIIIVECISSSINYIEDIRNAGYEPVILEVNHHPDDLADYMEYRKSAYSLIEGGMPERIQEKDTYEETLQMVKDRNPRLVIAGTDKGISLATHLAHDLGLPGNDPKYIDQMIYKDRMQEALKNAGLRHIRSAVISTYDEAREFFRICGKVVLKPLDGAATVGVCVCQNEEELKNAVDLNQRYAANRNGTFLIQEFIDGVEYVVDTVSCNGRVWPTLVQRYHVKEFPGYGMIYDYIEYLPLKDTDSELIEYAVNAIKTIGVENGVSHNEFFMDEHGPVLVEVNVRPCGGSEKASFQDMIYAYHETAIGLQCLLEPESFAQFMDELPDDLAGYGAYKSLIMYRDTFVKHSHVKEICDSLSTCRYELLRGDGELYPRTIDLHTQGGSIYLAGKKEDVYRDLHYIQMLEEQHPELLYES